jgi:hypothetical protein
MRSLVLRRPLLIAVLAGAVMLVVPAGASAATPHLTLVTAPASIFGSIAGALFGAFSWTLGLATKFFMVTLGALVKMLIPRSWAHDGVAIMDWIVQVPNYAGTITSPGGGHAYGFAGINSLRTLFMWLGVAIAPLTLTHAIARAMVDDQEPVGIPVLRMLAVAGCILMYPYLWAQGASLADQITRLILGLPSVTDGINQLMEYAVDGIALGGWQLIDLSMMGAIGLALLGLIFMKVVIILLGALLYATGPLMIGLVPTRFGHSLARAWASAVIFLLTVGIAWAALFAVGALLIHDSGTAGPLIAGNSTFGSLIGGLLLAVTGLATLWLCLKVTKEAGNLLRTQLGGLLALSAGAISAPGRSTASAGTVAPATSGASLRAFSGRLAAGAVAAGGELASAVPGGASMRGAMTLAARTGRRGVIGTAGTAARAGMQRATAPTAAVLGRSRAGQVAVAAARQGTATAAATVAASGADAVAGARTRGAAPCGPGTRANKHRSRPDTGSATAHNGHPAQAAASADGPSRSREASTPAPRPRPTATTGTVEVAATADQSAHGSGILTTSRTPSAAPGRETPAAPARPRVPGGGDRPAGGPPPPRKAGEQDAPSTSDGQRRAERGSSSSPTSTPGGLPARRATSRSPSRRPGAARRVASPVKPVGGAGRTTPTRSQNLTASRPDTSDRPSQTPAQPGRPSRPEPAPGPLRLRRPAPNPQPADGDDQ